MVDKENSFVLWFDQLGIEDVPIVGGKNASLGEMYRNLTPKGVKVPNGFAVTAYAYRYFLEKAKVMEQIKQILSDLNTRDMKNLEERGHKVRELIRSSDMPKELNEAILEGYKHMCKQYGEDVDVAVRSSATAEDLPDASFAGQQETYLNIRGGESLLRYCKDCFASLFTDRAISYRTDKKFDHFSIGLSIGVQKMVRSDISSSGVMFSIDTESGFEEAVLVTSIFGLGENIVQGAVNPDEFYVHKPTLRQGFKPIISKKVGEKKLKMIYTKDQANPTINIEVPLPERKKFSINDEEVLTLARWACIIEDHYSEKRGKKTFMDMEWAKDGKTNELYIVQARPETIHSNRKKNILKEYVVHNPGKVLVKGKSVGQLAGKGKSRVIKSVTSIHDFEAGEVLVTDMTDPDWEPIMKIASAIVTNRGGRTCHAAIISRELGIPCVVGTGNCTEELKTGQEITVDCSRGEDGLVYEGLNEIEIKEFNLDNVPKTKVKIMMNIGSPEQAFSQSFIPNEGVGLAREEFIINEYIKVHPLALLEFDKVTDPVIRKQIEEITNGYTDKTQYFIDKLAEGVAHICAAFYPKPVICRMSDFKSNEYANLIGGHYFEPKEDNPMIGWRGASRYYSDKYRKAFDLECKAFVKVRNEMGMKNLKLMIPMCRTVKEGHNVLWIMGENGLVKGQDGLQVMVMCEVPSNVILADQFLDLFDGFSIGSNDLTQLTLGVDRDSELVASVYDERNDAVKTLVKQAIEKANARGKYIGICGQAPSDYLDFAKFVVDCGIQTMSLNPDSVLKTTIEIAKMEK
jgi:pyruvate, water dikinase